MLDRRKPYVIDITDRSKALKMNDTGEGLPAIAIKCEVIEAIDGEKGVALAYYDIGCERGHILNGRIVKDLRNGVVFRAKRQNMDIKLTELTMEQFNARIRPSLQPEISEMLNDLDDVYVWYRQLVGMN